MPALWRVRPISVWDGDTLNSVLVDRGSDDYSTWSVRLKDVWAPEKHEPGGRECRDFVLGWLSDHADGSEWPFLLETFRTPSSDRDVLTFSRYVGVIRSADGSCLNDAVTAFVSEQGFGGGIGS